MTDFAVAGALTAARFPSPYTRSLVVDTGGRGNHTTIIEAHAAAVLAGAGTSTPFVLLVMPGTYAGTFALAEGVMVVAVFPGSVTIVGEVTASISGAGWSSGFSGVRIEPATGGSAVALKVTLNTSAARFLLDRCFVFANKSWNGATIAVELDGAGVNAILRAEGCTFYSYNIHQGAVTTATVAGQAIKSAKAAVMHTTAACKGYIEAIPGNRYKTATANVNATADAILAWTEGSGAYVGIHCDGHWDAIWAASPILHLNENATYKGGMVNATVTTSDTPSRLRVVNAHASAALALDDMVLNNLDLAGEFTAMGGAAPMMWPRLRSASYFQSPYGTRSIAALTVGVGIAGVLPITHPTDFNQLTIEVAPGGAGAAGATLDLYVFADNGVGRPGALVASGTVDSTTTGFKTFDIATSRAAPRVHWLVAVARGAGCSIYVLSGAAPPIIPQTNGATTRIGLQGTVTGGVFTYTTTSVNAPAMMIRTV